MTDIHRQSTAHKASTDDKKKIIRNFGLAVVIIMTSQIVQFSPGVLWERGGRFFDILLAMVPPDFAYGKDVIAPLWGTIQMSFVGTFIGAAAGFLCAFFTNSYINRSFGLRFFSKSMIHLLRIIPVLILALICTYLFGLGVFAGTVALVVSSFAVMARIGYEDMENISQKALLALESTGAGRIKAFVRTVLPAVIPGYLTNLLYLLEANVRNSAILGYVGAGGIGLLLNEKIAWRAYGQVGMIILLLYLVVICLETTSEWVRKLIAEHNGLTSGSKFVLVGSVLLLLTGGIITMPHPHGTQGGLAIATGMLKGLLHPNWAMWLSFSSEGIPYLLLETLSIAILGTLGGVIIAVWFSFTASFKLVPWPVAGFSRLLLLLVRTIPVFVYGLMWIRVVGIGPFAGVLTLSMCSIGLLSKRFIIAINNVDMRPWNAYGAMGVSFVARLRYGVMPQLSSQYLSATLYRLDVNLRDASVLGLVGAGGIGTPLFLAMMHYEWEAAGALLWGIGILVTVVELISERSRKK